MDNGLKRIIITESQFKKLIEVRYIDTSNKYKKDPYQTLNQEPIKNGESIRVFHGCDLETALNTAINGLSGQVRVPRTYSYENGMNPKGLFVTTEFKKAKDNLPSTLFESVCAFLNRNRRSYISWHSR